MQNNSNATPTGIKAFDAVTGGLKPGTVTLINNGEPATGFIREILLNRKEDTLVYSLAKSSESFVKSFFSSEDNGIILKTANRIASLPVFVSDASAVKEKTADGLTKKIGEDLSSGKYSLVIIDGIEILPGFKNIALIEYFVGKMAGICNEKGIPAIITLREEFKTSVPGINVVSLNKDVYGRIQASVTKGGERKIIENLYGGPADSAGVRIIEAERVRQIYQEGYSPEHDRTHTTGELADAAATYALTVDSLYKYVAHYTPVMNRSIPSTWPFDPEYYKPTPDDRIRQLAKAGAFIAAEIDRLITERDN